MAKKRFSKKQITYGAVGAVVALTLGVWIFAFFGPSPSSGPTASEPAVTDTATTTNEEVVTPVVDAPVESAELTIDPTTVSRIDIEPLEISVAYVRGIPGFGFLVERTASGTQYVSFSAEALIGTKCTDDKGVFASIIVNPSEQDSPTVTKNISVGGVRYGFAPSEDACTSNTTLFTQYQVAFRDAFPLLQAMNASTSE